MRLASPAPVNLWDLEPGELRLRRLHPAREQEATRDLPANCLVPEVQACFRPRKVLHLPVSSEITELIGRHSGSS
jgi:hypothetical protein